jgi:hypothetical protein
VNEADWKRALVKSVIAQGGTGFRIEDRYAVGRPDLVMVPKDLPVFFLEAKLVHGAKLICTDLQNERLKDLNRPPYAFARIIGLKIGSEGRKMYVGVPNQPLLGCLFLAAPSRLESNDWQITSLLQMEVDRVLLSA